MPGGALFGNTATGPGSTGGSKHLIEVRAGKMNLKGRMVYPDKRKGLLYVYQSDDSLMHFCWQDRTTGIVEDDLIIFPDDCEYVKVPQCTTGRVYLLKFKSSSRRFFFWLQEPRPDKDDENCKRINDYLNNPSGSVPQTESIDQNLQSLLNNMSQSQLMQLFGGGQMGGLQSLLGTISRPSGGSGSSRTPPAITHRTVTTTPATTTSQTPASPGTPQSSTISNQTPNAPTKLPTKSSLNNAQGPKTIQLSDLQNFLQRLPRFPSEPAANESVDLSTALTGETVSNLLSNPENLENLQGHLPPVDGPVQEQLRSTLFSPQFQQAVSQFSSALESGQLGPVVSQFSVNPEAVAAANQGNMQEFMKALEKGASEDNKEEGNETKQTKKEDKKDDDNDDGMQLD